MLIYIIKKTGLKTFTLPTKISGSYWIQDVKNNGKERDLINIKSQDGKWIASSNNRVQIAVSGKAIQSCYLEEYRFLLLKVMNTNEDILIYTSPMNDKVWKVRYNSKEKIAIGSNIKNTGQSTANKASNPRNMLNKAAKNLKSMDSKVSMNIAVKNNILYKNPLVAEQHAKIYYENKCLMIEDNNTNYGTFVNCEPVIGKRRLLYGDVVFVMGLKIIILNGFLYYNNPLNSVLLDSKVFEVVPPTNTKREIQFGETNEDLTLYNEEDYFIKSPRFTEVIERDNFIIEAPPSMAEPDDQPLLLTMGPMLTMGMTSVVYIMSSVNALQQGQNIMSTLPMMAMSISMLAGSLLWPTLSRAYNKKKMKKKMAKRDKRYGEYLQKKETDLKNIINNQRQILMSNYPNAVECCQMILQKSRYLWSRELNQDTFLSIRLGLGTIPLTLQIDYPKEHFTLEDDALEQKMQEIVKDNKNLREAPVIESLVKKNILAITGKYNIAKKYTDSLILQLITFHSYYDLKLVILTDKENEAQWEYLNQVPHIWTNNKKTRFFATTNEEQQEISNFLEKILNKRLDVSSSDKNKTESMYKGFNTYYLIITDNLKDTRELSVIKKILENDELNLGFSLIILHPNFANLPSECKAFITLENEKEGKMLESELTKENQKEFIIEEIGSSDLTIYSTKLANIPLQNENENYNFPKVLGFLEMNDVGSIEQLHPQDKWRENNPVLSLAAPVGVDENGNLFKLDLHEKQHGPHGLIAGMTGSGKSEFIITYILSMALNYHPDEVQFVLIDYKGGGLVGAFENKETGVRLPHLAGTITNLDTADIDRALASIESELKRRQQLFNEARDKLGEGTIDIYKYQRYYRDGELDTPISHLFIISDEFAELKDQQPDFMDQLISTARIGRSLGVHLILATQKPSGVVNAQIWSNSRFRVCLKVQDASDSNEMLKRPDAASLAETGRFYLQVGYNELFSLGQAAWAGKKYIPRDKIYREFDDSVTFIDNIGRSFKKLNPPKKENTKSMGEELPNIVKYLSNISKEENIAVHQLWLDKIPGLIYVDALKQKYHYQHEDFTINPVIGEYDNPKAQKQGLLTFNLTANGNVAIYSSETKNKIVNTIIYSLITTYRTEELNTYIIDLDTETLKTYQQAPQVGDVMLSTDNDKIKNLFKMLDAEIALRKKLFQNYNGNYQFYCKNSGKSLPAIVLLISGYENFKESFEDEEEQFARISRDCSKYGIYMVITAISERAMRLNTRSNFPTIVPLKIVGGAIEYKMLLGKKCPAISEDEGRGVVLINDEALEFQTATVYEETKMNEYVQNVCLKLNEQLPIKARPVPILPEKVTIELLRNEIKGLNSMPIGIEVESLAVSTCDFTKSLISTVSAETTKNVVGFGEELIKEVSLLRGVEVIVADVLNYFKGITFPENVAVIRENFIENLQARIHNNNRKLIFLTGVPDFIKILPDNYKNNVEELLKNISNKGNINIVLITAINDIKELAFQPWFKKYIPADSGIWVGKGLNNSTIHSISTSYRVINIPIASNYGYSIEEGEATRVKLIEKGGGMNGE